MSGFLCGVPVRAARREIVCPNCRIMGWHISHLPNYFMRLPAIETCTNCGERWDWEEGIQPRPFRRGWRQENIKQATKQFENSCACNYHYDHEGYLVPCEHQTRTTGCVKI